jgi:hypothetical protein
MLIFNISYIHLKKSTTTKDSKTKNYLQIFTISYSLYIVINYSEIPGFRTFNLTALLHTHVYVRYSFTLGLSLEFLLS